MTTLMIVALVAIAIGFTLLNLRRSWSRASRMVDEADAVLDAATRDRMKARVMEQIREGEL